MAIKRRDFQKLSSTVQEFLLKLPDEESSARLRDNLLHALHFLQLYYRILQNRDRNTDILQWTIDHSLSPLTPFREAPDKFEWEWLNVESQKVRQSLPKIDFKALPSILTAIKAGNIDKVKSLLEKEPASVNSMDLFNRDCLAYAIQYDQIEILKLLLKNGANTNNIASDSSTSLHRAVYKSNAIMVELLLEHKANINAQDCFYRAPLHWSVVNKEIDCLKILLKYKPNIHIKDKDSMSPSMWACHLDHLEHLKLINSLSDDSFKNNSNNIDLDKLEVDNDGRTWLHWSVRKNEPLKCLTYLINNETALLRDKEGKTCLHVAAEQGAIQASKIILEMSGFKIINERDNKKQTPLHLATLNGHARGIKILMDNGADPNLKDLTGASPIDYVTKRNLFFCNSIIEICMRNYERKSRAQGTNSQNSISSFNGSESNLTPAPPTTPKNSYSRNFQSGLGKPPRPVNSISNEFNKTAPASLSSLNNQEELRSSIPPSPPTVAKTRPNLRNGWNSTERILSGSLRLSRASTRTSLASDDLDKYMNDNYTSLNNLQSTQIPILKPIAPPRINSSGSSNIRIYSGRAQETQMSTASLDAPTTQAPPPIKPRKSSSVASLTTALNNKLQNNNNNLNVEDLSDNDDEYSITSVKGEGFASDLSDAEIKNQINPRIKSKKIAFEHNPKRPNTPMDIRLSEVKRDQIKNIKHPQNNNNNNNNNGESSVQRFNEWDPYKQRQEANLERQKSPLKSKHQSNFAQTFLHVTDSSPRQSSGRTQSGSAGQKTSNQSQFLIGTSNQETNSSSNLDLIISGQKLGSRKESSPTNTPREVSAQPENKRIYSRRLQPLDKNSDIISTNEGQFIRQKTSKNHSDRKKLEPIRGGQFYNGSNLNTSHHDQNLTHSITETDPTSQTNGNNDDEPSLSENTISSDRQQIIHNGRVNNKKKSGFGKNRKNLIGPTVGSDEALRI
ncbi:unnamed protein product [Brachionus calyciflorus]|uniref:Uncharacterized protein n=1 Tax=Brachionus calyciflorus TaxID=104777 RepID=A0A813M0S5_9BILA|nr:unnamed protein product [Brachionus calyciflorus]